MYQKLLEEYIKTLDDTGRARAMYGFPIPQMKYFADWLDTRLLTPRATEQANEAAESIHGADLVACACTPLCEFYKNGHCTKFDLPRS